MARLLLIVEQSGPLAQMRISPELPLEYKSMSVSKEEEKEKVGPMPVKKKGGKEYYGVDSKL